MLRDMQRHLEDLDNRNRRNNIRIRGLPESSGPEDLHSILQTIFKNLLGVPTSMHIEMDRAHRALRPKARLGQLNLSLCTAPQFNFSLILYGSLCRSIGCSSHSSTLYKTTTSAIDGGSHLASQLHMPARRRRFEFLRTFFFL